MKRSMFIFEKNLDGVEIVPAPCNFLASKEKNHARGNRPITEFLTKEMAEAYFEQFKDVVVKIGKQIVFVGNDYIQRATKTLKSLGVNLN